MNATGACKAVISFPQSGESPGILVIDEDPLSIEYVRGALAAHPVRVHTATGVESGVECARRIRPRLVLLALDGRSLEFMRWLREFDPAVQVLVMGAHRSAESVVRAIQEGAEDYLFKPIPLATLRDKVDRWLQDQSEKQGTARLDADLLGTTSVEGIDSRDPIMLDLLSKMRRIAPHFSTALVTGETGTGKELIARAMHRLSRRAGPFVVCNCAALVETLFESELFGYTKASFTGATADHAGLVESAENGTLFLDEVGEVPLAIQAKLLRFLQNREIRPVGGNVTRVVNVRVVAATNRNLRQMTMEGKFREDLFYRLSIVSFRLPRLRERKGDLPLLVRHIMDTEAKRCGKPGLKLARRAQSLVYRYTWPGNIRELENALSYACMLAENGVVDITHFPDYLLAPNHEGEAGMQTGTQSLAEVEREHTLKVLRDCDGNRAQAAEMLGISRATLYRILARP